MAFNKVAASNRRVGCCGLRRDRVLAQAAYPTKPGENRRALFPPVAGRIYARFIGDRLQRLSDSPS